MPFFTGVHVRAINVSHLIRVMLGYPISIVKEYQMFKFLWKIDSK